MIPLERCKACGLIMKKSKKFKLCPACGVSRKGFEDYSDRVSEKRRFILGMHLHPIALHFPQAIAVIIPVCIIGIKLLPDQKDIFISTVTILGYLFPVSALAAYVTGVIDGKTRFKKLQAPYLFYKILAGALFLIFSSAIAGIVYSGMGHCEWYIFTLSMGCIVCQIFLAQVGIKLMFAELPG